MDTAVSRSLAFDEEGRFHAALLSAFDDTFELKVLLRHRLGRNIEDIVSRETNREEVVFELIKDANAGGWWAQLLVATRDSRPQNSLLFAFAQDVGLAIAAPEAPAAEPPRDPEPIPGQTPGPSPAKPAWPGPLGLDMWRARLGEIEGKVCRVEIGGANRSVEWVATGFLLGPDIVMTAYYVMESVIKGQSRQEDVVFRFDYKRSSDGLTVNPGTEYRLAATNWLILASPNSPLEGSPKPTDTLPDPDYLNFALLRLDRKAGLEPIGRWAEPDAPRRGWLSTPGIDSVPLPDSSMYMVQHPRGDPLVVEMGTVRSLRPSTGFTRLRYNILAAGGSGGAPCFDDRWQLVAMHDSSLREKGEGEREGVLLGPIMGQVARQFLAGELAEVAVAAPRPSPVPPAPAVAIPLDGTQMEQLVDALVLAFPSKSLLGMMVKFGLNLNLETIEGSAEGLRVTTFNLVRWADAGGKVNDLVLAARDENPDNQDLAAVAATLGVGSGQLS